MFSTGIFIKYIAAVINSEMSLYAEGMTIYSCFKSKFDMSDKVKLEMLSPKKKKKKYSNNLLTGARNGF